MSQSRPGNVTQILIYPGLGSMKNPEIVQVLDVQILGVSERTVENDWRAAKAWLKTNLSSGIRR